MSETVNEPRPAESTGLTTKQALATVRKLHQVFELVETTLGADGVVGRIWAVYGVIGVGPPVVKPFDTKDELFALISELRARHNTEPDNQYFLHIFYGQRWSIQKGRVWKLWDTRTFEPIDATDVLEYLDYSGSLGDRPDLDNVVSAPAADPVEEDAESDALFEEAEDVPFVSPGPPTLAAEPSADDE